jgi:hypothetical protein
MRNWFAWRLAIVSFVAGVISSFLAFSFFGTNVHTAPTQNIIFPDKNFVGDKNDPLFDQFVGVSGTLTGEGVGYPNNAVNVACYKDDSHCYVTEVDQIGPNQIGDLYPPDVFDIATWNAFLVSATYKGECFRTTINIDRNSTATEWVQEPINQSSIQCKDADNKLYKWTVDAPPLWKK